MPEEIMNKIKDFYPDTEEVNRIIESFNDEQSKLFYMFVGGFGRNLKVIANAIEFCQYLLNNRGVVINNKTYIKHESDDEITGYILAILQDKVHIEKNIEKDKELMRNE